ncbi:hypothetical protein ACQP1V_26155 [Microtetraspora malaysiensis]|uniref:hypothetical protein n=1 Tax=Microtetraspora malaysiensis TaxID=161358 RepID=UPI003D8B7266
MRRPAWRSLRVRAGAALLGTASNPDRSWASAAAPAPEAVGEAGTGEQAVELARCLRPDLVLMDAHLRGIFRELGITSRRRLRDMPDLG